MNDAAEDGGQGDDQSVHDDVLAVMGATGRFLEEVFPSTMGDLTPGQEVVLALSFWGQGLYRGVFRLIQYGLPSEAQLLMRSLLEEATRIEFFRQNKDRLESMTLRFLMDAIVQEKALEDAGRHVFPIVGAWPNSPDNELNLLMRANADRGVKPSPKLPTMKDMATQIGHPEFYWMDKLFSMAVHTSRLSMGSKIQRRDDGGWWVGHMPDLVSEVRLGHSSANAAVALAAATAGLLGTDDPVRIVTAAAVLEPRWLDLMDRVGIPQIPGAESSA